MCEIRKKLQIGTNKKIMAVYIPLIKRNIYACDSHVSVHHNQNIRIFTDGNLHGCLGLHTNLIKQMIIL